MGKTYKKLTKDDYLQICKEYAFHKNGECLSTNYNLVHDKLLWKCNYGHIWEASAANIKKGKWCPECSNNKKLSLQDCIDFAKLKDGYCISNEYINSSSILNWKCKFGHIWKSTFNNIKSKNSWCPTCNVTFGENICRLFFEKFFNKDFIKTKPKWLITELGTRLELDGFNDELNIAFEYHGIQHYIIDGFFIKTEEQLNKRKNDDLLKIKLCKENNVKLIVIPFFKTNNISNILDILRIIMHDNGFDSLNELELNIGNIYPNKIIKYKNVARDKGGECLSEGYISYDSKLEWRCSYGHTWKAIGYSIEKGHWCPYCAKNRKLS